MDPLYFVPVIAQDLRREEYIIQVADTLEYLNDVINDVFSRINKKMDEQTVKTQNIMSRISICKQQVEKLTNINNAVKVLSASKYPAVNSFKCPKTIFDQDKNEIVFKRTDQEITFKSGVADDSQIQEKLEFYHVKIAPLNLYEQLCNNQPNNGLGYVPLHTENVTSLLLFNTNRFVYGLDSGKNHGIQKFLQNTPQVSVSGKQEALLEDAPFSISNKEQAIKKVTDSYLYSPGMGEVPVLDVPLDLPCLSGIAKDMQFLSEVEPAIAPSASCLVSDTEVIDGSAENSKPMPLLGKQIDKVEKKGIENIAPVNIQSVGVAPPPPPLPPSPPRTSAIIVEPSGFDAKHSISNKTEPESKFQQNEKQLGSSLDSRASLMEAIRNVGGSAKAKLRSVTPAKNNQKKVEVSSGGDLIADLHAKLSMRRKGISGDRGKNTDNSLLDVMSAMIPPPVPKNPDQSSNADVSSTEDDWE